VTLHKEQGLSYALKRILHSIWKVQKAIETAALEMSQSLWWCASSGILRVRFEGVERPGGDVRH